MARTVWGREAELTLAASALEAPLADPVALVLTGDEGIGKTTLWKAVLSSAEERGFRVLSAQPVESEAALAFAAVADLLREGFDEATRTVPAPQRNALEAALLRSDVEGSPDPRAVAFGFYTSLLSLARAEPLIVAVDDVQWLDAPSARVLQFALRRLEDVPVGIVLAQRTAADADPGAPLGLEEHRFEERFHRLAVEPLGVDAIRQILRAKIEARFPPWALAQIHEASGGNPFLAIELARALVRRGVDLQPGQPLPMPPALADLLRERLDALSEPVRRMLLLVAASPKPTLDAIALAYGDRRALDDAVGAAIAADVIEIARDRVQFSNPLLGTGLYSGSTFEERRHAHRSLAEATTDAEERARHLAQAADGPDEAVAQLLEDAAHRARSRGAPDTAAQLAELSRMLTPDEHADACTRRTANAGRYAFESAQIERAEELLQEAAEAATGPMRAEALLYLSRVRYHRRDAPSAAALAERALREARSDPSLQASINLELAAATELSGDHKTATMRARRAVRLAERSGDRTIGAEAVSLLALYEFLSAKGDVTAMLERARALEAGSPSVRTLRSPAFHEAIVAMWSDDLDRARDCLLTLEGRARDAGDESTLSVLLSLLSQIDSWAGVWDRAGGRADEARAVAEWTGQRVYLLLALYAQALVAALRGDAERAEALARESLAMAEQTGALQPGEYARGVLGFLALSRGDASSADEWLGPLAAAMTERGPADPGSVRFVPDEVEALIALDRLDEAEALLAPYESRARTLDRSSAIAAAARCRGLALAARRDPEAAVASFETAHEAHMALGNPLELGRTHLAKGMVLRRAKQWAAARRSLNESLRAFEHLGARLWAERARSELARVGGRSPYLSTLSQTEAQVADLVAIGLTNREVAARLFLSVSTVESNLRRAYRKLGVRSRAELSHKLTASKATQDR
jgi:DNA-binding CsgD family transcriptional regulator